MRNRPTNHEAPCCTVYPGDHCVLLQKKPPSKLHCCWLCQLEQVVAPNKLTSNFDKANFIKFTTNNKTWINLNIGYGLQIYDLHWIRHCECVIPKISSPCSTTQYSWQQTWKNLFTCFHFILCYGVFFQWNLTDNKVYWSSKRKSLINLLAPEFGI